MTIRELDTVVLDRDLPEHGLRRGDVGAVVFVHSSERFDVEFVRASGQTQALVELGSGDVRPRDSDDIPAVRRVSSDESGRQ
jgi:hypothetical protein